MVDQGAVRQPIFYRGHPSKKRGVLLTAQVNRKGSRKLPVKTGGAA